MIGYEEYLKLREETIDLKKFGYDKTYMIGKKKISDELGKALTDNMKFKIVGEVIDVIKNDDFGKIYCHLSIDQALELCVTLLGLLKGYEITTYGNTPFGLCALIRLKIEDIESNKSLLDRMKKVGFGALDEIAATDFAEGSESMKKINENVEKYLNYLTQEKVNESPNPDFAEIEKEIDELITRYKAIIKAKRETKASFISNMAEKISEIKKCHHNPTTHQEGHSHNPFIEDIRNL